MIKSVVLIWERPSTCYLQSTATALNSWYSILLVWQLEKARIWYALVSLSNSYMLIRLRWHLRISPSSLLLLLCEILALNAKWPICTPKTTQCNSWSRTAMKYSAMLNLSDIPLYTRIRLVHFPHPRQWYGRRYVWMIQRVELIFKLTCLALWLFFSAIRSWISSTFS